MRSIALMSIILLMQALSGCGGSHYSAQEKVNDAALEPPPQEVSDNALQEQWGIESHGIRLTAAGYMLDFRYRVVDAEKAAQLLDRRTKAYVLVEKSNARLGVPVSAKIGALRSSTKNVREERNYFIMFTNPGHHVQPGDQVSIVIGDMRTAALTVM